MKGYPERIDSKFRFVLLAARRAEQMMRGANPKVPVDDRKMTRVALREIREDAITWDYGPAPEVIAAEVEAAAVAETAPEVTEESQA